MFWRRKRTLDDFNEELQSHLAMEADQLRDSRVDPDAAAHRAFGNVAAIKESFYERGRWHFGDRLLLDFRHALRLIRRKPGFSSVVILMLALGIGANSAIFSLVDAVLLRPLPYKDPARLGMLWGDNPADNDHQERVSLPNFHDWKAQSRAFEDMTVYQGQTFLLGSDGSPERMRSARVPANFFPLLGVQPMLGRVFSSDEEQRRERVVVLSYRLWLSQFGGSAGAVGSDLVMDGRKSRIIGVMPPHFQFPFADTVVWEPFTTHPYWVARDRNSQRSIGNWFVLGRVRQNVTWAHAQGEMDSIARRLQIQYPESNARQGIQVIPLDEQVTGKVRLSLGVLFGSVFLMLLIACINVANLLLARGSVREREFAVRRALGAGRLDLARQLLTETLVLAGAGGALGLVLAVFGLRALIAFGPRDIPRLAESRIDPQALLFAVVISVLAAILAGLWPAVQSGKSAAGGRQWTTVANRSLRDILVAGEFALALLLITGAGLLVHSFLRLRTVDLGFHPENLLVMRVDLHVGKTRLQQVAYFEEAVARAGAIPGVRSAAGIGRFLHSYGDDPVSIEGQSSTRAVKAAGDIICGPYFQTAGIPLENGRVFSDQDHQGSVPVAIINEAMARADWPNLNPIGKRFRFSEETAAEWITVVGVAGDMHRQGLENQVTPQVFRPLSQAPDNELEILVRTASDPLAIAAMVRDTVQSIDKTIPRFGVITVQKQLEEEQAERKFDTSLVGLFSMIALLLSALGIYGLMHHSVVQRTQEIGVRVALGAHYGDVVGLILRQGLTLACAGVVTGVVAAFGFTRLLASLLYGVTPTDPVTFAAAPALLLAVAALACWIPARRAARIDPLRALRQE